MDKIKITLIRIGYVDRLINFKKIKKWKSKIFEIVDIQCIEHLSDDIINRSIQDGYLDLKYQKEDMDILIKEIPKNGNIAVAIIPYRFVDNHYLHRIDNRAVVSLDGIKNILDIDNISIENFIIRQLYKLCARSLFEECSNHLDSRGCLYDMNGNRTHIIYNTEKPIICDDCKGKIKRCQVSQQALPTLEKELKKIKKTFLLKVELCIKKYPLLSIIVSAIVAIGITAIFDLIWELIIINKTS